MTYCTYCAGRLTKPFKICPFCKKMLDLNMLKQIYGAGETSRINKWAQNKIWFKEHGYVLTPILTLVLGFGIAAFLLFSFVEIKLNKERSTYELQIADLQASMIQKEATEDNTRSALEKQISHKNEIISTLAEQTETLRRIINLTRHFAENSTVIPVSEEQSDYFKRNFRALNSKFVSQQKKMVTIGYAPAESRDLRTIPQLLSE